jgi:hypothetical protein
MKFYLLYLWTKINFVEKLFGQKIDPRRYKFSSGHFITDMYLCIPIIYVCSQCLCVSYNLGAKIDAWVQKFLRKKTILAVFSGWENWCLGATNCDEINPTLMRFSGCENWCLGTKNVSRYKICSVFWNLWKFTGGARCYQALCLWKNNGIKSVMIIFFVMIIWLKHVPFEQKRDKRHRQKSDVAQTNHLNCKVARFSILQYSKNWKNTPIDNNIYQITAKYTEWPWNIPKCSIMRPIKIFRNWDFWYENIPSGNPNFKSAIMYIHTKHRYRRHQLKMKNK